MTITFAEDISTRDAQRRLGNFKRRVLKENFGESISVREWTQRGRPHFHLAIDCRGDVATGFNWAHYKAVRAWSRAGAKGEKPEGTLNRTARLAALHRILREKAPLYGLGRIELAPVEKADAVGFYLGSYLSKSPENKPADAKGTRAVNYSRNCPRVLKGRWSWANEAGWCWRRKLSVWAAKHGCDSFYELQCLFGSKWAYHHREAILATRIDVYPSRAHAAADRIIEVGPTDTLAKLVDEILPTLPRGREYRLRNVGEVEAPLPREIPEGLALKFEPAPCVSWSQVKERSERAALWIERQSQDEQLSEANRGCAPSAVSRGGAQQSGSFILPPQPPSGGPRRAALARAGTVTYRLHTREELRERLKMPRQHYQRPLQIPSS